jgi:hypothetical protein
MSEDWVTFPGGELEGKRPKALCGACRERLKRRAAGATESTHGRTICFQCYRASLDRERAIRAAANLDTASEARFQAALPFEAVNRSRLDALKADRTAARASAGNASDQFADRRRHAQITARRALHMIAAGLRGRSASADARERALADAIHAAELQLPESWLPFVVAR